LLAYCKGQREIGDGGYEHWQVLAVFTRKVRLPQCKGCFCESAHCEPSRSVAADAYVWKEDTAVAGTRFELGAKPHRRNNKTDWSFVWTNAVSGNIDAIEPSIRVQHYRTLRTIKSDYAKPIPQVRECVVYWGPTGTGKSRRAWDEAGWGAYIKDPTNIWWDGYQDEENVIIDEYRGDIPINLLLQWLDRYPIRTQIKGSSNVLKVKKYWICSNLPPEKWYKFIDDATYQALARRLRVVEMSEEFVPESQRSRASIAGENE